MLARGLPFRRKSESTSSGSPCRHASKPGEARLFRRVGEQRGLGVSTSDSLNASVDRVTASIIQEYRKGGGGGCGG